MSKPIFASKTLWFNAVAVLVFVATAFGFADFAPDESVLALVAALVNLYLRTRTDKPVELRLR